MEISKIHKNRENNVPSPSFNDDQLKLFLSAYNSAESLLMWYQGKPVTTEG